MTTTRTTVDLSAYPDLVVIYLGMWAVSPEGAQTLQQLGPGITASVAAKPDGLLLHENIVLGMEPMPGGIFRQYWRDFASLEAWTRTFPHAEWWQSFLRNPAGTMFWHETYFMKGGMEAIYDNVPENCPAPLGFLNFAPNQPARGPMFSARKRLGLAGEPEVVTQSSETELYPDPSTPQA